MNKPLSKFLGCFLLVAAGIGFGLLLPRDWQATNPGGDSGQAIPATYDDGTRQAWNPAFQVVEISSSIDGQPGKAMYYRSGSAVPQPLVVSLHTWSGDYTQDDPLAMLCRSADLNYIHPDFRGPNWTPEACCSELALNDIDDSIDYALSQGSVDPSRIYVIGVSGGGYATLAMFMKSRHLIRKFSAWVPISDLSAWYEESRIRGNRYTEDILACTGSEGGKLDREEARLRSPLQWETPAGRLEKSELVIHAGVYDGIQGSVPITHSINFYNKVLGDLYPNGSENEVTTEDKARLLEYRKPLGEFGTIGSRVICLEKSHGNLKLVIFTGNHEMLPEAALNNLRFTIDD
jgi:pimeloyl-ACP methyl ester carboxylesterase